jgi:hypothetical protein
MRRSRIVMTCLCLRLASRVCTVGPWAGRRRRYRRSRRVAVSASASATRVVPIRADARAGECTCTLHYPCSIHRYAREIRGPPRLVGPAARRGFSVPDTCRTSPSETPMRRLRHYRARPARPSATGGSAATWRLAWSAAQSVFATVRQWSPRDNSASLHQLTL